MGGSGLFATPIRDIENIENQVSRLQLFNS